MNQNIPPVVSKRNHFESVGTMVEDCWHGVPIEYRTEAFRQFLLRYTASVVRSVSAAFETGAQRGIDQTAKLLIDPDYYATLKERRRRQDVQYKEREERDHQERLERTLAPTADQIECEETKLERWIEDSLKSIEMQRARLAYLGTLKNRPKHVRITEAPRRSQAAQHEEENGRD